MPSPRALLIAFAAAALVASAAPAPAQSVSGRATVVDGETLEIRGQRIRLAGIAQSADDHVCERTDDERWKCGPRAVNALDEFLEEGIVTCAVKDRDAAGRAVGVCAAGGIDISLWLLRQGLATASVAAAGSRYLKAQEEARGARLGLWAQGR